MYNKLVILPLALEFLDASLIVNNLWATRSNKPLQPLISNKPLQPLIAAYIKT